MEYLSIVAPFVAGIVALFGIWTAREVVVWKATIATCLTVLCLVIGILSSWKQQKDAIAASNAQTKRHREIVAELRHQFRALQTSSLLHTLEVRWTIPNAPASLTAAVALADAIEHSERLSDDEFDRMRQADIESVTKAWHIDNAVIPILAALADDALDAKRFYSGDVDDAIAAFGEGFPSEADPDEVVFNVSYDGPNDPILLLPLNVSANGVLALGRKGDDPRMTFLIDDPDNYDALWNLVALSKSFGFHASALRNESNLELRFKYESESLDTAVQLVSGQPRTIAWPDEFSLILIAEGFPSDTSYLKIFSDQFRPSGTNEIEESILVIVANGLEEAPQQYRVRRTGTSDHMIDFGAYDNPEVQFEFTTFHASRMSP